MLSYIRLQPISLFCLLVGVNGVLHLASENSSLLSQEFPPGLATKQNSNQTQLEEFNLPFKQLYDLDLLIHFCERIQLHRYALKEGNTADKVVWMTEPAPREYRRKFGTPTRLKRFPTPDTDEMPVKKVNNTAYSKELFYCPTLKYHKPASPSELLSIDECYIGPSDVGIKQIHGRECRYLSVFLPDPDDAKSVNFYAIEDQLYFVARSDDELRASSFPPIIRST